MSFVRKLTKQKFFLIFWKKIIFIKWSISFPQSFFRKLFWNKLLKFSKLSRHTHRSFWFCLQHKNIFELVIKNNCIHNWTEFFLLYKCFINWAKVTLIQRFKVTKKKLALLTKWEVLLTIRMSKKFKKNLELIL